MKIELTRFKIKKGKEKKTDEWMRLLNKRRVDCEKSLNREKMYIEAIFKEKINNEKFSKLVFCAE